MKKYILKIIVAMTVAVLLSACSNDTVSEYKGEQFFSFGSSVTNSLRVTEKNKSLDLIFGFAHPAEKDYTIVVNIAENTLRNLVTINGKYQGDVSVTIRKGETQGKLSIEADYDNIAEGADRYVVKLEVGEDLDLDMPTYVKEMNVTIVKPCPFNAELIKEWEGTYKEVKHGYSMQVTYEGNDIFAIKNFGDIDNRVSDPQLTRVKLDYSILDRYVVEVIPGYFYTGAKGDRIEITGRAPSLATLYGDFDACLKVMYIPYYQAVPNFQGIPGISYLEDNALIQHIAN